MSKSIPSGSGFIESIGSLFSDWRRYLKLHKKVNAIIFIAILFHNPGMFFSLLYRLERYLFVNNLFFLRLVGWILYPLYFIATYYLLDIDISPKVNIGKGLYIHNRGIICADSVTARGNLTLIGPITLGVKDFGTGLRKGPRLGDNVTIFTGARVIGNLKIGDNVKVGANAVVLKDVPQNSVVAGIPAKVIRTI